MTSKPSWTEFEAKAAERFTTIQHMELLPAYKLWLANLDGLSLEKSEERLSIAMRASPEQVARYSRQASYTNGTSSTAWQFFGHTPPDEVVVGFDSLSGERHSLVLSLTTATFTFPPAFVSDYIERQLQPVSDSKAVALWDNSREYAYFEGKANRLRAETQRLDGEIEEVHQVMMQGNSFVSYAIAEEMSQYNQIQMSLHLELERQKELEMELLRHNDPKRWQQIQDHIAEMERMERERQEEYERMMRDQQRGKRDNVVDMEYVKKCRKTFKRIAKLCHPDKTSNPILHNLFLLAKKKESELSELQKILREAQNVSKGKKATVERYRGKSVDDIEAELELLTEKRDALKRQLAMVKNTPQYPMAVTIKKAIEENDQATLDGIISNSKSSIVANMETLKHNLEHMGERNRAMKQELDMISKAKRQEAPAESSEPQSENADTEVIAQSDDSKIPDKEVLIFRGYHNSHEQYAPGHVVWDFGSQKERLCVLSNIGAPASDKLFWKDVDPDTYLFMAGPYDEANRYGKDYIVLVESAMYLSKVDVPTIHPSADTEETEWTRIN